MLNLWTLQLIMLVVGNILIRRSHLELKQPSRTTFYWDFGKHFLIPKNIYGAIKEELDYISDYQKALSIASITSGFRKLYTLSIRFNYPIGMTTYQ